MKKVAMKNGRRHLNLPGRGHDYPFSDGVLLGDTLYLSGRIGLDPKTGRAAENVEEEARLMLETFRDVLNKAGMTMDEIVYATVYCTDLSLFPQFNTVYRTFFRKEFPARAFLGVKDLVLGARFEIQGIAVKRSARLP